VDSLSIIEHKCFTFAEPTVFFENWVLILPLKFSARLKIWLGRQDYSFGLWPYSPLRGCRRFALAFKCFAFVEPTVFFENPALILPLKLKCKTENMAGAAGFEPTHAEIKTQCLTAWRRPICTTIRSV
jgi:hypothetical protein